MNARDAAERGARLRPWVERAWRGEGGAAAWLLRPAASLYAVASSVARARAAASRRRVAGVRVIAIGGLSVGGAGKTSLARWAALEAHAAGLAPALLLRGHGGRAASVAPQAVPVAKPDEGALARWFGDEAMAHRAALPRDVPVVVGRDRLRAARIAAEQGARTMILDDGWEQPRLAWDALWVAVDPLHPVGNGATLPAGPLRRPPGNLMQANAIVAIAEASDEVAADRALEVAAVHAPGRPVIRLRRRPRRVTSLDGRADHEHLSALGPVLLLSSVGAPDRLERFLAGEGAAIAEHVAFADHAAWNATLVHDRAAAAARAGAKILLVTDKDAARARLLPALPLEIAVLSTRLEAVDDPEPLRQSLAAPPAPGVAAPAPIG